MNFFRDIQNEALWQSFLEEKKENVYAPSFEVARLERLVTSKRYLRFAAWVKAKKYRETPISKKELVVSGKDKRRIVYCYSKPNLDYQYFFKFVNTLLREYDEVFSPNLFSFRSGYKIGNAVSRLAKGNTLFGQYKAKLDIHDYFRCINIDLLFPKVEALIDDPDFIAFLKDYLSIHTFVEKGKVITDNAGVFPGNPISGFLSNLFLSEMDTMFDGTGISYFRYADDILICASQEEALKKAVRDIEDYLAKLGLEINPKKKEFFAPSAPYHFLGLAFTETGVTISEETVHKIKGKIRRSARKIRRWVSKKKAKPEVGVKLFIKKYNAKFFGILAGEQSWVHWYFPYIRDDRILKEVDHYFYQEARYIMTGDHSKRGYKVLPYEKLQSLGHRSLVREFHRLSETPKETLSEE